MIWVEQQASLVAPSSTQEIYQAIEHAARTCTNTTHKCGEDTEAFLRKLIQREHGTPLEFASLTFQLTTSRAVMAEITRHRHIGFCVQSQRYVKQSEEKGIAFVYPEWYTQAESRYKWTMNAFCEEAEKTYFHLLQEGFAAQQAREVLPNCTATTLVATANIREWRHFFQLRCDKAAYPQTRNLSKQMLTLAYEAAPVCFEDLAKDADSIPTRKEVSADVASIPTSVTPTDP